MSNRQKFEYSDDIEDTWEIIDRLSRMVWERDSVPLETKNVVQQAATEFHRALRNAGHDLPRREVIQRAVPPRGANFDEGHLANGWRPYTIDRLAKLTTSRDVGSVAEAFLKATPALDEIRKIVGDGKAGFVFRGQRNIEWPLIPTLGRDEKFLNYVDKVSEAEFLENRTSKTSKYECDLIDQFKEDWKKLSEVDQVDRLSDIDSDDPSWWFRMQHYSENGSGTRLLDVTSSIPAALLFACLDWDSGLIDDTTDGILYLFVAGMNANQIDFANSKETFTDDKLFTGFADAPVFFLNPPHNERSKAQSGAFLWWPKFWEQYSGQIYYLRVLKERKREIIRELLLLNFGPKDVVRGQKGLENEVRLRSSLGL